MSRRDRIGSAVGEVLFNASNYPKKAMPHILGQDIGPLREKVTEAVMAALEEQEGDLVHEIAKLMLIQRNEARGEGATDWGPHIYEAQQFLANLKDKGVL